MRSQPKLLWAVMLGTLALPAGAGGAGEDHPAATRVTPPTPVAASTTRPAGEADVVELKDVDGVTRRPLEADGAAGVVVLFIAHECPISNGYSPEIIRICNQYGVEGPGKFRFYLAHVDPTLAPEGAKTHAQEFGYTVPVLMDTDRKLAGKVGARVTPEAAVITPDGTVAYRGRIDDRWVGYGRSRVEPTTRDLRAALDAILAGKPVPVAETRAVGCPIE